MKRILRIATGCLLTGAGMIGLLFPVIPGWPFLIAGILMLAADIPLLARGVCWIEYRFPRVRSLIRRMHKSVNNEAAELPCSFEEKEDSSEETE